MMDRTVYYTHRSLYEPPRISSSRDERESPATTIELSLVEEMGGWGLYAAEGQGYIWLMPHHPAPPGGGEYTLMSSWMADDPRQPQPAGGIDDAASTQMTYRQALREGYVEADTALQRGYVSRLANPDDQPVQIAGGSRHGQLYVLLNNPQSNRYCIRQYLRQREAWEK